MDVVFTVACLSFLLFFRFILTVYIFLHQLTITDLLCKYKWKIQVSKYVIGLKLLHKCFMRNKMHSTILLDLMECLLEVQAVFVGDKY